MSILKRAIPLLLCVVMLVFVLAACDTDSSEEPPSGTTPHTHIPATKKAHDFNQKAIASTYLKDEATCTESAVYFYSCACGAKGTPREILFPGVTSYQNKLGGTVVVFSGVTNVPYHAPSAFGFLNETRKAQIVQILKDLDCLPIYYPEDAEMFMKAAKTRDGKLFCAILNMGLDAIDAFPLATDKTIRGISRLMPNGSYETVDFRCEQDRVELALTAYPYDPVVLLLDVE